MNKIRVKLDCGAYLPERAHAEDAGYDLRTPNEVVIRSGSSVVIDTGVHMEIPFGYFGKLESKSGLNVKHSIVSLGGVIDSGYTGSIQAKLYNFGESDYTFHAGDKVVQLVLIPCDVQSVLRIVDDLGKSERGDNGFGSTGR